MVDPSVHSLLLKKFKKIGVSELCAPRKEDINNEDIKNLAMRLKGRSDSETLNNVLEWQEKNIVYWSERRIADRTIAAGISDMIIFKDWNVFEITAVAILFPVRCFI
ncbi:MAG: transglutaminase-like domain-containing protein [Archaeoglobaceae archaeon]